MSKGTTGGSGGAARPLEAALAALAAAVFDLLEQASGSTAMARKADAAIVFGLVGATAAAVTGLADWSKVGRDRPRRIDSPEVSGQAAEITDRVSKSGNGGKALLFENTGYEFPVLMNAYGSERRMCLALGVQKLDDIAKEIEDLKRKPV